MSGERGGNLPIERLFRVFFDGGGVTAHKIETLIGGRLWHAVMDAPVLSSSESLSESVGLSDTGTGVAV